MEMRFFIYAFFIRAQFPGTQPQQKTGTWCIHFSKLQLFLASLIQ
jgi:hypothetical protein